MSDPLHVYLIAGEPSGDILGMRLMTAIRSLSTSDNISFSGVGGPLMEGEGLTSLFPMSDLTVMGLTEVLPRIPKIFGRIRQTAADIRAKKPDVIVTIDAPDFCFRVAKRLAGLNIPIVHYVAPSVWAWRSGRANKVAKLVDHVMCLLPFEPPYFERAGVDATFVGHSILESGAGAGDGDTFRSTYGIPQAAPVLVVLPGSRKGEVSRLLSIFGDTISQAQTAIEGLRVVVPTVANVADAVRTGTQEWSNTIIVEGEAEKYDAFAAANAALAASGTVSLELAMAGVPSIIGYRLSPLTAMVARRLIRVKYASIVNIILDREAMPEFLQERCTADQMAPALIDLLKPGQLRDQQSGDIAQALKALQSGDEPPSSAATKVVIAQALSKPSSRT